MNAKAFAALSVFLLIFTPIFNINTANVYNTALAGNPKEDDSSPKKENITVEIRHCDACGFQSRALELADELKKESGIEALLTEGETGSFDVFVNGELIFSKYEEGRFPNPGEIVQKIKDYMKK